MCSTKSFLSCINLGTFHFQGTFQSLEIFSLQSGHISDNLNDTVQSLKIFSLQPGHISLPGHQLLQADLTSYNMTVQSEATEKNTSNFEAHNQCQVGQLKLLLSVNILVLILLVFSSISQNKSHLAK